MKKGAVSQASRTSPIVAANQSATVTDVYLLPKALQRFGCVGAGSDARQQDVELGRCCGIDASHVRCRLCRWSTNYYRREATA